MNDFGELLRRWAICGLGGLVSNESVEMQMSTSIAPCIKKRFDSFPAHS